MFDEFFVVMDGFSKFLWIGFFFIFDDEDDVWVESFFL